MTMHITQAAEGLGRLAFTIADLERMVEVGIPSQARRQTSPERPECRSAGSTAS